MASILFFCSGATGLAYEVIWFKRFTHVWGSSSIAMAAVVASFLCGLGIGAQIFGRIADRTQSPLRMYGWCELAVGLLAILVPLEIQILAEAVAPLSGLFPDQTSLQFLVRFLTTLFVIGPPCIFMGATLPLLVRHCTDRQGMLSDATGWLYGINTLGAAVGCFLAGFYLLPLIGLFWSNLLAAATNLAIAAIAFRTTTSAAIAAQAREAKRAKKLSSPVATTSQRPASHDSNLSLGWIYAAILLSGCGALVLQMTWSRQLAVTVGGSTYAFSANLFVVLLAMALGSLIYHRWIRPAAWHAWAPMMVVLALAASTVIGKSFLPALNDWAAFAQDFRVSASLNALFCVATSAALELIPALCMGILFPLLVQLTEVAADRAGRVIGNAYAWSTIGSLPGATLTAEWVFPAWGTSGAIAIGLGFYLGSMLLVLPRWTGRAALIGFAGLVLGIELASLSLNEPSPVETNMGKYHYGATIDSIKSAIVGKMFIEGSSCNVFVTECRGVHTLRVNGKVDASDGFADMQMQLGAAYFPRMIKSKAEDVLVIGYGSGTTVGASLLFPESNLTCCELEPAVFQASPLFANINHSPESFGERFKIVFTDGRSYLQGNTKQYDLIISEPSNPWIAGVSNLFTQQFFETARSKLKSGGVLAQWLQTYRLTVDEYALIVRTLQSVFPHTMLLMLGQHSDTVLLASDQPLFPTRESLAELQAQVDQIPEIAADLQKYFGTTDVQRLCLICGVVRDTDLKKIAQLGDAQTLNTDLNLRLEFDAPLHLFRTDLRAHEQASAIIEQFTLNEGWIRALAAKLGLDAESPDVLLARALSAARLAEVPTATQLLIAAGQKNPAMIDVYRNLADLFARIGSSREALTLYSSISLLDPKDTNSLISAGDLLSQEQEFTDAIQAYRMALKRNPELHSTANNLAWLLATIANPNLRNGKEALELAKQACAATNYENTQMIDTLAAAHAELGDFERAAELMQQVVDATAKQGDLQNLAEVRSRQARYASRRRYNGD
jgi:spermidine synthase